MRYVYETLSYLAINSPTSRVFFTALRYTITFAKDSFDLQAASDQSKEYTIAPFCKSEKYYTLLREIQIFYRLSPFSKITTIFFESNPLK